MPRGRKSNKAKAETVEQEVNVLPPVKEEAEAAQAVNSNLIEEKSLYGSKAAIAVATEAFKHNTNAVMIEGQRIACSVIKHLAKHRDISVVRNMLKDFPLGFRKQALSKFFDMFAPVTFDDKGEVHFSKERQDPHGEVAEHLAKALVTPWWKTKDEQRYIPFDLASQLKRVLSLAKKRLDVADPAKGDKVDIDSVVKLEVLVKSIEKAEPVKASAIVASKVAALTEEAQGNAEKAAVA